ncbi:MAG: recombination mediator RecR [Candidatus Marinimicrobia bacterium]|jgi:recombination protein RecR|nr:recombination mediator RecR [Candidatus Neomarinimicrobiota bacterium]|tara:strand:+ start:205 stop:798 length:594 start_codon:yes stop_codon:yes gene_type:complete
MESFPDSIIRLIDRFSRFPGIGKKTAQRMAFHILKDSKKNAQSLADAVQDVKSSISGCSICGGITEDDPCIICSDPKRNKSLICVVEVPSDIFAFERTSGFNGVYHVLGGALSPLDGIGPDDLNIDSLVDRVKPDDEIVLALNPSIEGDTTCLYISKLLSEKNTTISRLARGLPVGSELEYTDDATLMRAMEGRTII